MKLDMHFHSTASDGHSTRGELIALAQKKGLDFIALTDHDIVSYGFQEEARKAGILSCQSVEISANNKEHDKSLHLTFYAKEISQEISEVLSGVVRTKTELIKKQIKFFNSIGFQIDLQDFYTQALSIGRRIETLNKLDIVLYIYQSERNIKKAYELNGGVPLSAEEFYLKFLKKGGEGFAEYGVRVKDYEPTIYECKKFVQQSNGILSIAHPNVTFRKGGIEEFERVLPYYIENGGVNAIEINAKATQEWILAILKAKDLYGLYLTFGSDNHKIGYSDAKHGDFGEINPLINNPSYIKLLFSEYRDRLDV